MVAAESGPLSDCAIRKNSTITKLLRAANQQQAPTVITRLMRTC